MSKSVPPRRFEPSAEILAAAKTRLPLRLPLPDSTGPHRAQGFPDDKSRGSSLRPDDDLERRRFVAPSLSEELASSGNASPGKITAEGRPFQYQPTDVELEDYAQQALYRTGIFSFSRLWVEVQQQRAVVFGTLRDDFEVPLALQAVRRVNGIVSVEHQIQISGTQGGKHVRLSAQSGGKRRSVSGWLAWAAICVLSNWLGWRALLLGEIATYGGNSEED